MLPPSPHPHFLLPKLLRRALSTSTTTTHTTPCSRSIPLRPCYSAESYHRIKSPRLPAYRHAFASQSRPKPKTRPKPQTTYRGPSSSEQTQTDFSALDVLAQTPAPVTGIDACTEDGFALNSGTRVSGGKGVLLVGGEAFAWMPWTADAASAASDNHSGSDGKAGGSSWEVPDVAWGVLELVWPKPDLLIIGTGTSVLPLSRRTRKKINDLGIRVEVQDTRNAAAQFNLLATERGVEMVAAALVPLVRR